MSSSNTVGRGNVTGVTQLNIVAAPKRLELLHELVPTATAMVLLIDPTDPAVVEATTRDLQAAANNSLPDGVSRLLHFT
jgi:putative tryptophan/tyrosine transport system substrate-binding protein